MEMTRLKAVTASEIQQQTTKIQSRSPWFNCRTRLHCPKPHHSSRRLPSWANQFQTNLANPKCQPSKKWWAWSLKTNSNTSNVWACAKAILLKKKKLRFCSNGWTRSDAKNTNQIRSIVRTTWLKVLKSGSTHLPIKLTVICTRRRRLGLLYKTNWVNKRWNLLIICF